MPLTLGVRYWDHVVPLVLGDVGHGFVHVRMLDNTPDLWRRSDLDGGETSFSRYVRARAEGDDRVVALPLFLMRGFRHRCILVRRDSPAFDAAHLEGACIGLTGWSDSGNTWTRAVLREAGVGVGDASWQVGPLTGDHPSSTASGACRSATTSGIRPETPRSSTCSPRGTRRGDDAVHAPGLL